MDIGTLTGALELDDELSPVLKIAESELEKFADAVEEVFGATAIAIAGAITAVTAIGSAIVGLGVKGSTLTGVEDAFDRLAESAGTTGDILRESLTEGVKGTIDDMEQMQATTRLLGTGMQLTGDQAKLLGTAARELGKATGTSAASGLEILSTALTTGRTRALQAQGVIVDLKGAEEAFAKSLGVTASQLSTEGKLHADRIAILQATQTWVDRIGVSELTFKERLQQTSVSLQDWGDELSKSVSSSPHVMAALDAVLGAFTGLGDGTSIIQKITVAIDGFADAVTASVPYVEAFFRGVSAVIDYLREHKTFIETVTKTVLLFGAAWAVVELGGALVTGVVAGLTAIATGVGILTAAIAANPLGALAVGATIAGTALYEYIKAQNAANKAAQEAGPPIKMLSSHLQNTVPPLKAIASHSTEAAENFINTGSKAEEFNKKVQALSATLSGSGESVRVLQEAFAQLTPAQLANYDVQQRLVPEIEKLAAAGNTLTDSMKAEYEAAIANQTQHQALANATLQSHGYTLDFIDSQEALGVSETALAIKVGVTVEQLKKYIAVLNDVKAISDEVSSVEDKFFAAMDAATDADNFADFRQQLAFIASGFDDAAKSADDMGKEIEDALNVPGVAGIGDQAMAWGKQILGGLSKGLQDIGPTIVRALEGGGDIINSIAGSFGLGFTENMFGKSSKFASMITNNFSGAIGDMINSILPGVGALVGPLVSKIAGMFKSLFGGPSAAEVAGRQATDAFTKSLEGALSATEKMEVHQLVAAGNSQKWATQAVALSHAYVDAGHTVEEAQQAINALWEAEKKGPEAAQYVQDQINAVLESGKQAADDAAKSQQEDQDRLTAAVEKYKFSLEELGPALQKQALHDQALQLIQDWQVLLSAGIDLTTVNSHMADSMSEFLNVAIQTGQEVPKEMEPMIQQFIDTGSLLDENGNRITDMGQLGIHFAETMSEGFDRVVAKLNDLIAVLGGTTTAISDAGDTTVTATDDMKVHVQSVTSTVLASNETISNSYNSTATTGVMAFGKLKIAADAAGQASVAAAKEALEAWKQTAGYMSFQGSSGGFGSGTSEGRNESGILSGLTESQAESVYINEIANKGSTEQDWNRVKDQFGFAKGGIVPSYYAAGTSTVSYFPGGPSGSDTVPAWLTPGEGVVSKPGMRALDALNAGMVRDHGSDNYDEMLAEMRKQGSKMDRFISMQPTIISNAVKSGVQIGLRGR